MELKKYIPWNWFKKEEESGQTIPAKRDSGERYAAGRFPDPMQQFHHDLDRMFDRFFRGSGSLQPGGLMPSSMLDAEGLLKPKADLSATEKEYVLTVEIPGVSEKDISLEISGGTMTIKGEKRQKKEEKDKDHYRIERSYGSFQRVLSLPEDVNQESIKAGFKHGVLTVTMPRKTLPAQEEKQIKITAQ